MIRIAIICLCLCFALKSFSQKNIEGLIQAEKNFAAYSVAHGVKDAFLKFLDSNGIVFDQGKAVPGIKLWNTRENRPGILKWWPQYAEVSFSNDFGYTTGPWTFQQTANDSIIARGQYTTVWHINKDGEWKFLIDLGVGNTPLNLSNEMIRISASKESIRLKDSLSLISAEKSFIELFYQNKVEAYKKFLSKQSILNRMKQSPALSSDSQKTLIDSTSASIQYSIDGWNMSSGLDIGYAYGRTVLYGKTENYQRIWRHEKDGWKIALEVLRY